LDKRKAIIHQIKNMNVKLKPLPNHIRYPDWSMKKL